MPKYSVSINKFDGGLNTKVSPTSGEPNESPESLNVEFDDVGAVSTRLGNAIVNTAAIAVGSGFDLTHNYRSSSGQELISIYESIYALSGTSFLPLADTPAFTAGVRVWAENALDYVFMSNGTNKYKFNGDETTIWGIGQPSTSIATSIAAGNSSLAGSAGTADVEYRFATINSTNVESPASEVSTFTVSSTCSPVTIDFDTLPASHGVNYISVYRDDYLLDTVSVATSTVTDNFETLTTARDETIVDQQPPDINVFLWHKGYMFGTVEDSTDLYYSEINSPESWPSDNYIRVGYGDGMTIRGIAIYNDGLVIAKEDGQGTGRVFVLYMPDSDPDNWSLEQLDVSYGSVSPMVMTRFAVFLAMINRNGIFDLSTTSLGKLDSKAISYNIEPNIKALDASSLHSAAAITYGNKLWIAVTPQLSNRNSVIYQYDFIRGKDKVGVGAWSKFTGVEAKHLVEYGGYLYYTDYGGYLRRLDTGHTDEDDYIESYYKTMYIFGQDKHREYTKVWRYIYITVELTGAWNMRVEWQGNFSTAIDGYKDIDLDAGGAVWGSAEWGIDTWGKINSKKTFRIPIHSVAKAIQVKFSVQNAGEYFKVYELALHYNLRGAR